MSEMKRQRYSRQILSLERQKPIFRVDDTPGVRRAKRRKYQRLYRQIKKLEAKRDELNPRIF